MDTIIALSTAPVISATGVLRLSGNDAFEIVEKMFSGKLYDMKSHTVKYGKILDKKGNSVDEVLITVFRAPHSYTGENVVEISCHGSPYVLKKVTEIAVENGARHAEAGEFTKRAFINGKLDLAQAEAVIDLIEAETAEESGIALKNLNGDLSCGVEKIRTFLIDICAQILAYIDYPDDEIVDTGAEELEKLVSKAFENTEKLRQSYTAGRIIKNGVSVVICGKPNVGKSSVMNRLAGFERCIVTDIAGTTRDVVEEKILFGGMKFLISDTAGIHEGIDDAEKKGIIMAEKKMREADLIFFVLDANTGIEEEDMFIIKKLEKVKGKKIALINKCDIFDINFDVPGFDSVIKISAKTGYGFDLLEQTVKESFSGIYIKNNEILMNTRQYSCVCRACACLKNALDNIRLTPDVIITDLEESVKALGEVTGKTVGEEIVENIFSRFCVGK